MLIIKEVYTWIKTHANTTAWAWHMMMMMMTTVVNTEASRHAHLHCLLSPNETSCIRSSPPLYIAVLHHRSTINAALAHAPDSLPTAARKQWYTGKLGRRSSQVGCANGTNYIRTNGLGICVAVVVGMEINIEGRSAYSPFKQKNNTWLAIVSLPQTSACFYSLLAVGLQAFLSDIHGRHERHMVYDEARV